MEGQMKEFKIKVKDVKDFVKSELALYASGAGKRFSIALHAGPNVNRYIVEIGGEKKGFTNAGAAVRHFNGS
jgi:hypothetical protein